MKVWLFLLLAESENKTQKRRSLEGVTMDEID